jgi:hypothetical protein
MKIAFSWDIEAQVVPHRGHITSPLCYVRFQILTMVIMKIVVFWDVMPCGSCKKQCFTGKYLLH